VEFSFYVLFLFTIYLCTLVSYESQTTRCTYLLCIRYRNRSLLLISKMVPSSDVIKYFRRGEESYFIFCASHITDEFRGLVIVHSSREK
jgi:hypothetical protein